MSSGAIHDRAILFSTPAIALVTAATTTPMLGLTVGVSYLVGGWWLSPDLDTPSRPFHRWGYLKVLWLPYQKAIPHRSPLSHGVIVGTLIRVGYLFCFYLPFFLMGVEIPFSWFYTPAVLIGLECSAWCHLFLDFGWKKK